MDKLKVFFKIAPKRTVFNVTPKHMDKATERALGIFENAGLTLAQLEYRCFTMESNASSQRV